MGFADRLVESEELAVSPYFRDSLSQDYRINTICKMHLVNHANFLNPVQLTFRVKFVP
jgi:hypothetical protein